MESRKLSCCGDNLYRALIDAMQEGVIFADAKGVVQEINACAERMLNVKRSEVVGSSLYQLHPPAVARRIRQFIKSFSAATDQDLRIINRNLFGRWVQMRFSALRDSQGEFCGLIANLIDESEIKRLADQQRSLELKLLHEHKLSAIGILASGIAHNLNGPLSVIVGYLDLLYSRHPDLYEIPLILSQTERMQEIIRNMMIKSRQDQDSRKQSLKLNNLLQNELCFLEANLDFKHKINKYYEFSAGMPMLYGVYSDFSQCFINLINNAIDAMADTPIKDLFVQTRYDRDNVYVEIRDTGCGIDPDSLPQIFSPFYTTKPLVGEALPESPTGTGLGLYSSHQIISTYSGRITAESQLGRGSKFTMIIPIEPNRPPQGVAAVELPADTAETTWETVNDAVLVA